MEKNQKKSVICCSILTSLEKNYAQPTKKKCIRAYSGKKNGTSFESIKNLIKMKAEWAIYLRKSISTKKEVAYSLNFVAEPPQHALNTTKMISSS